MEVVIMNNGTSYNWLRFKTPQHLFRIREKLCGSHNAFKTGRFSKIPRASWCNDCPRLMICPYYVRDKLCIFVQEKIARMEKKALKLLAATARPRFRRPDSP
jgi:hypothetical protein